MTYSDKQPDADLVTDHLVNHDGQDKSNDSKQASVKWPAKIRRWAIRLAIFYIVIILFLMVAEPVLVYPALLSNDSQVYEIQNPSSGFVEKLSVETEDNILIDTFHFCPVDSVNGSRGVLLFCHGNGEWIDRMIPFLVSMGQSFDVSVVCFDYRGYGLSQGFPHESGICKDADAVYQAVIDLGYPAEKIVVFGRSIGGGPSCYIAANYKIGGLVLRNTFSSLVDVAANKFFWVPIRLIMRNRFDSVSRLKKYQGPLLQTHGTSDRVVPFQFGRRLYDSVPTEESEKEFLVQENAGHNDPMSNEFRNKIKAFLDRVLGPRLGQK